MCLCVWKMVHDRVSCDEVVCAKYGACVCVCACVTKWCVTKMCVTMVCVCVKDVCGRWYVLKMVCEKDVCVCERWCDMVCDKDVCGKAVCVRQKDGV